ncbi:MAG: hypothetical protein QOH29_890 [Actinomycetota bacterium]|jgi:hypothetical protein|nr:hypothetical protein [Actinomycetota bacterium]
MEQEISTAVTRRAGRDYSTAYTVEQSPAEVYAAILNVPAWWTGQVEGTTDVIGAEFSYRHPPQHYSRQRVSDLEPGGRVVWQVVDSELSFVSEPAEWTGSEIVFEIAPVSGGTELRFTHVGLMPDVECYDACSSGWIHYVTGSLHSLITTGAGLPDPW